MSRRRRAPHDLGEGVREWKVKVLCTDRGRHPEVLVGRLRWWPGAIADEKDGGISFHAPGVSGTGTEGQRSDFFGPDLEAVRFHCPQCGREVLWGNSRAKRIAAGLAERRVQTVDISLLG